MDGKIDLAQRKGDKQAFANRTRVGRAGGGEARGGGGGWGGAGGGIGRGVGGNRNSLGVLKGKRNPREEGEGEFDRKRDTSTLRDEKKLIQSLKERNR